MNAPAARKETTKSAEAFRTISEAAETLDVPQHVLRFWETKFTQIKPLKRAGGRRYYRPEDVNLLRGIRALLYTEGFTIKGVQKLLREEGPRAVAEAADAPPKKLRGRTNGAQEKDELPLLAGAKPIASHAIGPGTRKDLEAILARLSEAKTLLQRGRALRAPRAKAQGA